MNGLDSLDRHQLRLVIFNRLRTDDDLVVGARTVAESIDGNLGKNMLHLLRATTEQPVTLDSLMTVVDAWLNHREQQ